MAKKNLIIIGIIIILVLLGITLLVTKTPVEEPVLTEQSAPAEEMPITEPEEVAKAPAPLVSGKQVFDVITSGRTFKMVEVELDPVDVKLGEEQLVRVFVKDTEDKPITSENKVEGAVFTDNKSTTFSFELKQVSDANGATLTIWEGSWLLDDTYDKIYMVSIVAKSADDEHKIDIALR